jgi:serine/threonine protein kinase
LSEESPVDVFVGLGAYGLLLARRLLLKQTMIDVGQSVGNYNITAKLGEGGMGMVFLAEHPVIGSKVALKAIHPQFARNAEVVSRFVNEAKAVNQIGHDHIVDITDFGNTPLGNFYFIMEYLQGETLSDLIKANGPLPPARSLKIAAQIADALNASHEHGVIHRDLKPDNIFLIVRDGSQDFVKVLDFGLAKLTHADDLPTHNTRTGSVMGTPYYMSPEQCEGKVEIDHRSDIYSLGVILFEMLTGKIPFGGTGYGEILVKHVTVQPPSARSIVQDLPLALDMILFRALSKDPRQRFQTMSEFQQALLDPETYASNEPAMGVHDDLSGRIRAALPMTRTEINLRPNVASGPTPTQVERLAPSTFQNSAGEVGINDDDLKPKRHRGRVVLLMGVAALTGLTVASVTVRHQATRFLAAAVAPRKPVTVRVNFNSDPEGATVESADGTVLGVTPLSTEVPYGDTAIGYAIGKVGYLSKAASIVPNLASPLFAVLQKDESPKWTDRVAQLTEPPTAEPPEPVKKPAVARSPHYHSKVDSAERVSAPESDSDSDGVLDPSYR